MDRLAAMTAFVTVAELRSFAAAARRLRLSPPAVTRLVAALEDQLAIRLLQRTTRSVTLTGAGARYLERSRRILADVEDAERATRAESNDPTGRLLVAAPNVFGRREVAPLVSDYLTRYPAVICELELADRLVNLIDDRIDIAVRIGVLEDSSLRSRSVGATRRVVVASPAYLARQKRLRSLDDLKTHTVIQFTALSPTAEWRFHCDGEERRIPVTARLVTNSADAAIEHAERGSGLAMVLGYQVADLVKAGRLEVVLVKYEPPPLPIQLVHASNRYYSANVRTFIEMTVATRNWQFVDF
ncbi:MAG TPA: LysR family transcriptional regulator [Kofleriaceae bacterium]|jgi:DNA-binding transcriptional LysR family regulator